MEIIVSSIVGAISAIVVAIIHNKTSAKKRDKACDRIINTLNVDRRNIYIIDSKEENKEKPMHYSNASAEKVIFLIK